MAKDKKREKDNGRIIVTEEIVTTIPIADLQSERANLVNSRKSINDRIDEIDSLLALPDGEIPEPSPGGKKDKP
jgi:hypothetical protein